MPATYGVAAIALLLNEHAMLLWPGYSVGPIASFRTEDSSSGRKWSWQSRREGKEKTVLSALRTLSTTMYDINVVVCNGIQFCESLLNFR